MKFLRLFFRILARNTLFSGGGRGPTPEELSERDDYRIYDDDRDERDD